MFNVGDRFLYKCDPRCNGWHPTWNCKGNGYRIVSIQNQSYYLETKIGESISFSHLHLTEAFVLVKKADTFGYRKGLYENY